MVSKVWGYLEVLSSTDLNNTFAECATLTGSETLNNKILQLQSAPVTPVANTLYSEGIIKAWGSFYIGYPGSTSLTTSFNVNTIDDSTLDGNVQVNLKTGFSSSYVVVCSVAEEDNVFAVAHTKTNNQFIIKCYNDDGTVANNVQVDFIAIGAQ